MIAPLRAGIVPQTPQASSAPRPPSLREFCPLHSWPQTIINKSREMAMPRRSVVASLSFLVFAALLAGTGDLAAQTGSPALTGKVTAGQDALEGVLVSAKKSGSPITVTVVSDKDGRYSFPATRLEPGQYSLSIRAVGYELGKLGPVEVAADRTATSDLTL